MMDNILISMNYYLIVGVVWLLLHELLLNGKMTNGMRFRLWVFWPVTLVAWILGFVDAFINSYNEDE